MQLASTVDIAEIVITPTFLITKHFSTPSEFSEYIVLRASAEKAELLDVLLDYCSGNDIDPSAISKIITPNLKELLRLSAEKLNLIKKTAETLPL
jgi:hypothetical protein